MGEDRFPVSFGMWSSSFYVTAFLLVAVHAVHRRRASDYFDICHRSDPKFNDCIKKSITNLRGELIKGIPSLNILPLDPLIIEKMELTQGNTEKFHLREILTNIVIHGLSHYTIRHSNLNYDKKEWNITMATPFIGIQTDFDMDGKIMVMPLQGRGKMHFLCKNVTSVSEICLETYEHNKQTFARVKDYKLSIEPNHCQMNMTNVSIGDKRVGEGMNRFLNMHWKEAYESYRQVPEKAFADVLKAQINYILAKFPEHELFPL